MTTLFIVGLVWLGCAAVVVLALCAAAHKATPEFESAQELHSDTSHVGPDYLRKAA